MATTEKSKKKFGIDHKTGRLGIGGLHVPLPRSRAGRITIGSLLMVGGCLGFLPVLGFWMVPLGFLVLSHDIPVVRRKRRRLAVWWAKRQKQKKVARGVDIRE